MNVANLLSTKGQPVVTVRRDHTVRTVVTLLAEHSGGALIVVDDEGKPLGIVTERHIVRRLGVDDQILRRAVGEIMTRDLVTATPQED